MRLWKIMKTVVAPVAWRYNRGSGRKKAAHNGCCARPGGNVFFLKRGIKQQYLRDAKAVELFLSSLARECWKRKPSNAAVFQMGSR